MASLADFLRLMPECGPVVPNTTRFREIETRPVEMVDGTKIPIYTVYYTLEDERTVLLLAIETRPD